MLLAGFTLFFRVGLSMSRYGTLYSDARIWAALPVSLGLPENSSYFRGVPAPGDGFLSIERTWEKTGNFEADADGPLSVTSCFAIPRFEAPAGRRTLSGFVGGTSGSKRFSSPSSLYSEREGAVE